MGEDRFNRMKASLAPILVAGWLVAFAASALADADEHDVGRPADVSSTTRRQGWWQRMFRNKPGPTPRPAPTFDDRTPRPEPIPSGRQAASRDADSDWMLVSRCQALLFQDGELSSSAIYVSANRGELWLRGSVPSAALKDRATRVAQKTPGVRGVRNDLEVLNLEQPWFQRAPVVLGRPMGAAENAAPTNVAAIPSVPAVGGAAAQPDAPIVVLEGPRTIASRPGRPTVMSYTIMRPSGERDVDLAEFRSPAYGSPPTHVAGHQQQVAKATAQAAAAYAVPGENGNRYVIPAPSRQAPATWTPASAPIPSATGNPSAEPDLAIAPSGHRVIPAPTSSIALSTAAVQSAVQPGPPADPMPAVVSGILERRRLGDVRFAWAEQKLTLSGEVSGADSLASLLGELGQLPGVAQIDCANLRLAP